MEFNLNNIDITTTTTYFRSYRSKRLRLQQRLHIPVNRSGTNTIRLATTKLTTVNTVNKTVVWRMGKNNNNVTVNRSNVSSIFDSIYAKNLTQSKHVKTELQTTMVNKLKKFPTTLLVKQATCLSLLLFTFTMSTAVLSLADVECNDPGWTYNNYFQ